MFSMMISRLQGTGVCRIFLFKSLYSCYSTTPTAIATAAPQQQKPHFLEGFLINSLGFSREEALSATNKLSRYKSTRKDPILVINFLEKLGLEKTQIKSMVFAEPELLLYDVDKTLKPKIGVLQELGLSGSDLVNIIFIYKSLLKQRGGSRIKSQIEFLRNLLGSYDNVARAVRKCPFLLHQQVPQKMGQNVAFLREIGFSDKNVSKFILGHPRRFFQEEPKWFEDLLHRVEIELGISRHSKMFYYGFETLSFLKRSTINAKVDILRSYGWSDLTIYNMVKSAPNILRVSEDKLRKGLNFFMKELGFTPDYLASCSAILALSFEKRVKPRSEVLKILNEKKLNSRKATLVSVLFMTEPKFLNAYLLPHKDEIPNVYDEYIECVGRPKSAKV